MLLYLLTRPPTLTRLSLFTIVKVLAPMFLNWLLIVPFIESIAVNMPTKAIIPNAMIKIVNIVRKRLERIELTAIFRFSLNRLFAYITDII